MKIVTVEHSNNYERAQLRLWDLENPSSIPLEETTVDTGNTSCAIKDWALKYKDVFTVYHQTGVSKRS